MSARVLNSHSAEETERLGERLAQALRPGDVLALTGDLGAGKTCFVRGLARGLGIGEPVTSPTFNMLLVHQGTLTLYHFDLYRLEREAELEDIDFRETLELGGVSAIEWGDRFPRSLPVDVLFVELTVTGDSSRSMELRPSGPRSEALAVALYALASEESR